MRASYASIDKGPFTNDVIVLREGGGLQIITVDDGGEGWGVWL